MTPVDYTPKPCPDEGCILAAGHKEDHKFASKPPTRIDPWVVKANAMKEAYQAVRELSDEMVRNQVKYPCFRQQPPDKTGDVSCIVRKQNARVALSHGAMSIDLCPVCQLLEHVMEAERRLVQEVRVQHMREAGR